MKITSALRTVISLLTVSASVVGTSVTDVASAAEPIVIGTASPGGVYLTYGQDLARILSRELGREITAQPTQGPAQNIVLLEKREVMLAFTTMGVGLHAWNGTDWAKGTKYRSMRVIFPMYDTPFQFVAPKRLGINWLDDFSGRRIGVGPRAGTGGTYVPEIFKALDINASIRYGAFDSMATQLAAGDLEGVALAAGFPTPALTKLGGTLPLDFIRASADQIATIKKRLPEFSSSIVPAGTYSSLDKDYQTVGLYNFAFAHKDVPDDVVYSIVKAVFANRNELLKTQAAAKETIPENIDRNTTLPVHPGAARYYREIGVKVTVETTN
jgi:TRAP transporter TAXI family solute receptor